MLVKRIATALFLIPIVFGIILFGSPQVFFDFSLVLVALMTWEYSAMLGIENAWVKLGYFMCVVLAFMGAHYIPMVLLMALACAFWLVMLFYIAKYPVYQSHWNFSPWMVAIIGIFALVPPWMAMNVIRSYHAGAAMLVLLLCIIWVADSGAYFSGKKFGKRKLMPSVSPNKTIEGLYGNTGLCVLVGLVACLYIQPPAYAWLMIILFCVLTGVFSVIGDLFVSMLKRARGIKDTGKILPGHGGLLDRLDSILTAAPFFALGVVMLGYH